MRFTVVILRFIKKLDEFHIPYVFIQGTMEQLKDHPYVMMDDCKGGYLITKYLLETGHRQILGMFKADDRQGMERHRGYVRALQEYGVLYDPDRVIWFHTEDRAVKPFARLRVMAASGISLTVLSVIMIRLRLKLFRHFLSLAFVSQRMCQ